MLIPKRLIVKKSAAIIEDLLKKNNISHAYIVEENGLYCLVLKRNGNVERYSASELLQMAIGMFGATRIALGYSGVRVGVLIYTDDEKKYYSLTEAISKVVEHLSK